MAFRDFRKKEGYLERMKRVGWGLGKEVGRAIFVKAPKSKAVGEGIKKRYGRLGDRLVLTKQQGDIGIRSIPGATVREREIYSYMLADRIGSIEPGHTRGVTAKKLEDLFPKLVKQFGERRANDVMKRFGVGKDVDSAHSILRGGKSLGAEYAERHARNTPGFGAHDRELLAVMVKSLVSSPPTPGMPRGITHAAIEDTAKEIERKFGKAKAAAFERGFLVKETSAKEGPVEEKETARQGGVTDMQNWRRSRRAETNETPSWRRKEPPEVPQ